MTERVLTAEAERELSDFEAEYAERGCTCFISPPCSYCTHPGNPLNQECDDTAWVALPPDCDCRQPAPTSKSAYGGDYVGCLGCRGKVSMLRILNENIRMRE